MTRRGLEKSVRSHLLPPSFSALFHGQAQCREKAEKAANASYLSLGAKGLSACRHITLRPPHTPARLNLPSNPPFPSFSSSNSRPVVVPLAGVCLSRFPSSFSPPLLYSVSPFISWRSSVPFSTNVGAEGHRGFQNTAEIYISTRNIWLGGDRGAICFVPSFVCTTCF